MFQDRKSLGQEVVEVIKNGIRNGDFAQGERIVESRLARDLGLSLTPIREAVRELVGEGILTVSPNRGPSVRILSPHDAFELYTLRAQLECLAIRLAIRRSTLEEREAIAGIFTGMEAGVDDPASVTLQDSSRQNPRGNRRAFAARAADLVLLVVVAADRAAEPAGGPDLKQGTRGVVAPPSRLCLA